MNNQIGVFDSIKFKMMAGIAVLVALIMMGVNWIISEQVRGSLMNEILDKGRSMAKNLSLIAEEAILTKDDTSLFIALSKSVEESKGILYALVIDENDRIIAHNHVAEVDSVFVVPEMSDELPSTPEHRILSYIKGETTIYDVSGSVGGVESLGEVHIGIAGSLIDDVVEKTGRNIILMTLGGVFLGGLGAFVFTTLQVKPILMLVAGVKAIGEGRLDQRINIKRRDEIGALTNAFNEMAIGLQEREFIRQTFQKFVHKDIANELLKNPDMIKVGGERKKATIMFTDIRRFTSLAEKMRPEDVIDLLNDYFAVLVPVIAKYGGVLDKFIGDAMMVVFGIPVQKDGDALKAVKAGLKMKETVDMLNEKRKKEGKETVILGIGINTGYVVAGNVGSEVRMEYTVLGDAVNVAARLEGLSTTGDVIISEHTYEEVKNYVVAAKGTEKVSLKGKSEAFTIYRVERLVQEIDCDEI